MGILKGRTYNYLAIQDAIRLANARLCQAHGTVSAPVQQLTSSDAAQAIPEASLVNGAGYQASSALITVENASIRYAFGVAPTQAGLGHLVEAGQSITIDNPDDVASFQFISAAAGTPAVLQATLKF